MRALDLVVGMVNPDNLTAIVGRLMRQLRNAPIATGADEPENDRFRNTGVVPYADSDDEDAEEALPSHEQRSDQPPPLPDDYRTSVIRRILEMCSRDTYSNITDFEWYIDVLTQLVRVSPAAKHAAISADEEDSEHSDDVGAGIGHELQNVAIRVRSVRHEAVDAAQSLVLVDRRDRMFPASGNGGQGVLEYAGWLVGEYATYLSQPEPVMTSLLHPLSLQLSSKTLAVYLQAVPKVFSSMAGNERVSWTPERKTLMSLLMARIVHFLEPLSTHPSLEVQERAVEYLELMRLAAEAASGAPTDTEGDFTEPPLLLTQAIPALFSGAELNPVAPGAQRKVPIPDGLDLDTPINSNLHSLLSQAEQEGFETEEDDVYAAYSEPIASYTPSEPAPAPAADRLDAPHREPASYQNAVEEEYLDPDIIARRKAERKERYKDDPFYIDPEGGSGAVTPLSKIVRDGNKDGDLDIDSIPIMDLDLSTSRHASSDAVPRARSPRKPVRRVEIMGDETLGPASADPEREDIVAPKAGNARAKKNLLQVDSAGLAALSLDDAEDASSNRRLTKLEIERKEQEEAEMARALQAIERSRLEMQRASERVEYNEEGVVKKKKKKVRKVAVEGDEVAAAPQGAGGEGEGDAQVPKKKKKKKVKPEGVDAQDAEGVAEGEVKKKKKKKRVVVMDE
jgi:AP-3 complex subunit delta-1